MTGPSGVRGSSQGAETGPVVPQGTPRPENADLEPLCAAIRKLGEALTEVMPLLTRMHDEERARLRRMHSAYPAKWGRISHPRRRT